MTFTVPLSHSFLRLPYQELGLSQPVGHILLRDDGPKDSVDLVAIHTEAMHVYDAMATVDSQSVQPFPAQIDGLHLEHQREVC